MRVKLVGQTFNVEPETPQELIELLDKAKANRAYYGQGAMPSVELLWHDDDASGLKWRLYTQSPAG